MPVTIDKSTYIGDKFIIKTHLRIERAKRIRNRLQQIYMCTPTMPKYALKRALYEKRIRKLFRYITMCYVDRVAMNLNGADEPYEIKPIKTPSSEN